MTDPTQNEALQAARTKFYLWRLGIERDVVVWDLTGEEIDSLVAALTTEPAPSAQPLESEVSQHPLVIEAAQKMMDRYSESGMLRLDDIEFFHRLFTWLHEASTTEPAPSAQPLEIEDDLTAVYMLGKRDGADHLRNTIADLTGTVERQAADNDRLIALLRRIEPHLDAIVCYASTMGEHEPNRLAHDVRAVIEREGA